MPIQHTIRQGDSITSLAEKYGHFVETIWDHPDNAQLKELRQDMDILMPGDVVVIPDKRLKEVKKPDKKKHVFKRRGVPAIFRMQVFTMDQPRANEAYRLNIDGRTLEGTTDDQGVLEQHVPTGAREGVLIFDSDGTRMILQFGHLNPIDDLSGVQQRLKNLGIYFGPEDGQESPALTSAIQAFQSRMDLEPTGELDQPTRDKLEELHDSKGDIPVLDPL